MYRPIGYRVKSPASVLIPAAKALLREFNNKLDERVVAALSAPFSDRRHVKNTKIWDFNLITKEPMFADLDGDNLKNLLHIVYAVMANAGFPDYRPTSLTYSHNALMSIDDVITECMNAHIPLILPKAEHMDRDKTGFEVFRGFIPEVIKQLVALDRARPWYLHHFRRYIGNLLYRIDMGEMDPRSCDQFDLTLLTVYANPSRKEGRSELDGFTEYRPTVARDSDPETAEVIGRMKAVIMVGNSMMFQRLLSNKDRNELIFSVGPAAPTLDLVGGTMRKRGPFQELDLSSFESITWSDEITRSSTEERVQYLDDQDTTLNLTGVRVPYKRLYTEITGDTTPILLDYGNGITMSVYRDATGIRVCHEWRSAMTRRLVSTKWGASADTMLTDLALTNEALGDSLYEHLQIDGFRLVDMDETVKSRMIETDNNADEKIPLFEKIYYVCKGKFISDSSPVDMTLFYGRIGNLMFKPALSEFFRPNLNWFNEPDQRAYEHIVDRLQLSDKDAKDSIDSIMFSHNVEKFKRITGATDSDVAKIINVEEYARVIAGFTGPQRK